MKKSNITWILSIAVFASGIWADFHYEIDMFPASMFTIPYSVALSIMGIIYYFLEQRIGKGALLILFNVCSWYTILYSAYFFTTTLLYFGGFCDFVNLMLLYIFLSFQVVIISMLLWFLILPFFKRKEP